MTKLPLYDELPIDAKYPKNSAWGIYGEDDNLGTLNLLTRERSLEALKYATRGRVFSLNWDLDKPEPALFKRTNLVHSIEQLSIGKKLPIPVFDDKYTSFNTQTSTQWDGLSHFPFTSDKLCRFYNGVTAKDINDPNCDRLGIHHIAQRGIVGRAVLLDYARWAGSSYNPLARTEITVDELEQVAKAQKVKFLEGDILLIRTGWMEAHEKAKDFDPMNPTCAGIKACQETFRWLWNNRFSAIAADNFPVEAFPFDWDGVTCHSQLIGGWGMPMGELFYLEELAEDSANDGVYVYCLTSAPLNKRKGVASPANVLCLK
ncbi:putative cyclase-domain-containing protein [Fennellomyces sp. T-0311]|nr:putative cyclase-domain-containing protein [Fennellomyces sp. T-0311]